LRFAAKVIPSGNATAVEVPGTVMAALGPEGRPPIVVTINGHSWRSRIAAMRGQRLIGISAANRAAAGIAEGDTIEVEVERDDAPREVELPADLAEALDGNPRAAAAFAQLAFGLRAKHVRGVEDAKNPEVRQRRIAKLVESLGQPGRGVPDGG
jgi:uncharacterized protein YdeI (YjbR/CyaY-like superfamily)